MAGESLLVNRYQCIEDLDFQDWLARVGLIVRPEDPMCSLSFRSRLSRTQQLVFSELFELRGYLVSTQQLVRNPYGNTTAFRSYDNMREVIARIRHKMNAPDSLITVRRLGFGLDITSFRPRADSPSALYLLRQNNGTFARVDQLALRLYGYADHDELEDTKTHIDHLRRYLTGSLVGIEMRQPSKVSLGSYRLVEINA